MLARELLEPVDLLLLHECVFLLLCPDSPHWLVVKVMLDLLSLVPPSKMVPARSPSLPCPGNWPGMWPALKLNTSSGDMRLPYAAPADLPTSPLCYPGAERVTYLSLSNLVSSKACYRESFFFINCQPVPSLTAEGAPWDGSADLAAPQQTSAWMFRREDGFIEGQGQSPNPLGLGEPNKSQPSLARISLQTVSHQQKKVTKFLFFPAKSPLFFFLLGCSSWELVHPCTSCADPCNLCTALGMWLPTLILHVPATPAHAPPNQTPSEGLLPCE